MQGRVSYCPYCGEIYSPNVLKYKLTQCPSCKSNYSPVESKYTVEQYQKVADKQNSIKNTDGKTSKANWNDILFLAEIKKNDLFDEHKYEARVLSDSMTPIVNDTATSDNRKADSKPVTIDLDKSSGKNIRTIARIIKWIGILESILLMVIYFKQEQWEMGIILAITGIFAAIIISVFLHGFSEIVDNSHIIAQSVSNKSK